jgi:transcriptional regulator with XRE-family HTH domain
MKNPATPPLEEIRVRTRPQFTTARHEPAINSTLELALLRLRGQGVCGEDIAQRVGISGATFSRIRRGRRVPSASVARAIAEAVGSTVMELWPDLQPDP